MATTQRTGRAKAEGTTPKTPRAPRKTDKYIRNLRGTPVHIRLGNKKDPYRIELSPRGLRGDVATVPYSLQGETAYVRGVGILFEIITQTEVDSLNYGIIGYSPDRPTATLYKEEDTVISTQDNIDTSVNPKSARAPKRRSAGMNVTGDPAGSDQGLAEQFTAAQAADEALPPNAFPTRVTLTKVTEVENRALKNQLV